MWTINNPLDICFLGEENGSMDKKSIQKKLLQISAERHELWEGGVSFASVDLEERDRELKEDRDRLLRTLKFFEDVEDPRAVKHEEIKPGWYQDIDGYLYLYDGVVWDEVPPMPIKDLEYLSGE